MKILEYTIDDQLFEKYVESIHMMQMARGSSHYKYYDETRSRLHDLILLNTGTDRADVRFNFKLAKKIEGYYE